MADLERLKLLKKVTDLRKQVAERKAQAAASRANEAQRKLAHARQVAEDVTTSSIQAIQDARARLLSEAFSGESVSQVRATAEQAQKRIAAAQSAAVAAEALAQTAETIRQQLAADLRRKETKQDTADDLYRDAKNAYDNAKEREALEEAGQLKLTAR